MKIYNQAMMLSIYMS